MGHVSSRTVAGSTTKAGGRTFRPGGLPAAIVLVLGLSLRLWFVAHAPHITGDTVVYGGIARNWLEHGVYSLSRPPAALRPTLIRLPGYPLFLGICFVLFGMENYHAVLLVQIAVDLSTCLLIAATAKRLFGPRAGMAALSLACLCPFTASYTAQPLTETLTLCCIAAAYFALARWQSAGAGLNRWIAVLGTVLGYAILLRPEQGLLAAAILPAMLWVAASSWDARTPAPIQRSLQTESPATATSGSTMYPSRRSYRNPPAHTGIVSDKRGRLKRALVPAVVAALLTLLPLVPWTIRNYRTFHVVEPLAPRSATDPGEPIPAGFQHWFRTWAVDFAASEDVYWNYDGTAIALEDLPERAFDTPEQKAETAAILDAYNADDNPTPALEASFDALASERIRGHWFRYYVALPVARVVNMVFRPRTENTPWPTHWWRFHEHPVQSSEALAYGAVNLAYLVLAGVGVWRWQQLGWTADRAIIGSMLAFILLRLTLLLTLDNSEPRYTLEFFPVLIVFASARFTSRSLLPFSEFRTRQGRPWI